MKYYKCSKCKKEMVDNETSIRFRCQFCGKFVDGWKNELHTKLKESFAGITKENKGNQNDL